MHFNTTAFHVRFSCAANQASCSHLQSGNSFGKNSPEELQCMFAVLRGSKKGFLITVAEEENMSRTRLCCNRTRAATPSSTMHEQSEHSCYFSCFGRHIRPRKNNHPGIPISVFQCLQRGGWMCWLHKTVHAFFFTHTQLLMWPRWNSWNSLCANSHFSSYDMWHARYIYIVYEEWTNIGKQVVRVERQMLHCTTKPWVASLV